MRTILLKMSGEAIADETGEALIGVDRLDRFSSQVGQAIIAEPELRVCIVVGGGNILRGKDLHGVQRTKADHMGMLATVINALALQDSLTRHDVESRVMTGIEIPRVAEPYIHGRAIKHLNHRRVVIFGGGTGNTHLTTDTAAALRAAEMEADILLLAKFGTDGVYNYDPNNRPDAQMYEQISFGDVLAQGLQFMDVAAVGICRDNQVPIYVFNMETPGLVYSALTGADNRGTMITHDALTKFTSDSPAG